MKLKNNRLAAIKSDFPLLGGVGVGLLVILLW
jgi:hypothetical protein